MPMPRRYEVRAHEGFGYATVILQDNEDNSNLASIRIRDHELSAVIETLLIQAGQQMVMTASLHKVCVDVASLPSHEVGQRLPLLRTRAANGL